MSDIYIFLGPSLAVDDARQALEAIYLPPVSQGDVVNVARRRPWAIGIIDGYFERMPAVWHKEILRAMADGIHVFGSASMGALRAAELHTFGMEGIGAVFEAFRNGELEDDDEVAVIHGPPESGYRALSLAMVNLRFTLAAARRDNIIDQPTHQGIVSAAKALFYADREVSTVLTAAAERGLDGHQLEALRKWLPTGRVDQKRDDALAMLRHIRDHRGNEGVAKSVTYTFQHTETWEMLRTQAALRPLGERAGADTATPEGLLDELRLLPDFPAERQLATNRVMALELADRHGVKADTEAIEQAAQDFRRQRQLYEPEDMQRWLTEQSLTAEGFARLIRDQVRIDRIQTLLNEDVNHALRDQLRASDRFAELEQRAHDKQRRLADLGFTNPDLNQAELTEEELFRWYFEERLNREPPSDLEVYSCALGYRNFDDFRRATLRELLYVRTMAS